MALREEFEQAGNWLFRWRSYLPLLAIGPILLGVRGMNDPGPGELPGGGWDLFSLAVSLFGLGVRMFTVGFVPQGTSGRNTRRQVAEVLNTTGIYSIVRHPIYLGNYFIWLGILLFSRSPALGVIFTLVFFLYYERMMFAEEEFLRKRFGDSFLVWAEKTPALLPNFKNWQRPVLPFCFRAILNRECSGLLGILAVFSLLDAWRGKRLDLLWSSLLIFGSSLYLLILVLKKKTMLLHVEGR